MEALIVIFAFLALGMAIMSCVYENKYFKAKQEIKKRDEAEEHDDRDEVLYHAILAECDKKICSALSCHCDYLHGNDDENPLL